MGSGRVSWELRDASADEEIPENGIISEREKLEIEREIRRRLLLIRSDTSVEEEFAAFVRNRARDAEHASEATNRERDNASAGTNRERDANYATATRNRERNGDVMSTVVIVGAVLGVFEFVKYLLRRWRGGREDGGGDH